MTYAQIIQTISENILTFFDEVYHSAELIFNDKNEKIPAVSSGKNSDGWIDLSPKDKKETIYIRRNGDDEVLEELRIGSCGKSYKMKTPIRVVFFKDHAKNHNEIIFHLMQSVLVSGTKLRSISRDKWSLQKEESSGNYNFGSSTAYFAIDIYVMWELIPDNCPQDFCLDIVNPLKKELCPAVA